VFVYVLTVPGALDMKKQVQAVSIREGSFCRTAIRSRFQDMESITTLLAGCGWRTMGHTLAKQSVVEELG
jgi:hypothetical protein